MLVTGNRELKNVTEFAILAIGEVKERLVHLLLNDVPVPVSHLDPNVVISVIRRFVIASLVFLVKHIALK